LDINEVFFDEDGDLVRTDGGTFIWSLGNHSAKGLAQDVRRAGLI
jgi:hypothetical protein